MVHRALQYSPNTPPYFFAIVWSDGIIFITLLFYIKKLSFNPLKGGF